MKKASALKSIGEIHLGRGELAEGVDYLLDSLTMRPISQGTAHDAAVRLEIIYEAAGRHGESQAIARVAAATANPDVYLAHEYAEELRSLVRTTGAG